MIHLQETIEVPRPLADVFNYTSNFSNVAQWDPGITESTKLSPGHIGVGTRFRVVVKFGLSSTPMDYVITAYEPPDRVVLKGEGGSIRAIDTICFSATDEGTRIDYSANITFTGWTGFTEPFLRGLLNRVGKNAVEGLQKALTEQPPPPSYSLVNNVMDRLIVPGMLGFTRLGYAWHKRSWQPLPVSLNQRTAVITGATSGLGRAAAERLAALGAQLILVGRDPEKTAQTQQDIIAATGNEHVSVEIADLGLVCGVEGLAQRLLAREQGIHILINNAGVLLNERKVSAEGIETTLATNLLAPFLLTNRLIPLLRQSAPARIINVSSGGMYTTGIRLDDLQYESGTYDGSMAYARTKRALVMLTELWANQLEYTGVVVHAMHPGWADTPGVSNSLPGFYKLTKTFLRTPEQGADTIVWLAAAPEVASVSGRFWLDREPHITSVIPGTGGSRKQAHQLRDKLEQLVEQTLADTSSTS
ncbi:MAG: SDR family NAD(P)-dependent oxidoreductase [Candidatus Competibacteraceae bacterium]|jgi:NAD(P)-dependent dehydrogenase (short-subunit alcohol dehydrogenase family)/carbon monoxide dehydrogenase subunit G|nr:SDR family NAD(P)-dependent oxidoreductase [Candidatus Competibacteraceae bacterium]